MSGATERQGLGPVVAWDVYERRIYGAPGETRHRVLWVEHYRRPDGTTPDLDEMLRAAREGGIDSGARTIHVRPLHYSTYDDAA